MKKEDLEFIADIFEKSHWLFYGDLDATFDDFVKEVFQHDFKDRGFGGISMDKTFSIAYWLFLSELVALNLAEYGTSPRGSWLTDDGERFKKIFLENENITERAQDFIHDKYN